MNINDLLNDKTIKPKEKIEKLSQLVLDSIISINEVITFASNAKDSQRASCIEALEFATGKNPSIIKENALLFVIAQLAHKAPRVKWESAKVIANTIHLFPMYIEQAVKGLLDNTEHSGTVVRWSAATALSAVYNLRTNINEELIEVFKSIIDREEKPSIKKIYEKALK